MSRTWLNGKVLFTAADYMRDKKSIRSKKKTSAANTIEEIRAAEIDDLIRVLQDMATLYKSGVKTQWVKLRLTGDRFQQLLTILSLAKQGKLPKESSDDGR